MCMARLARMKTFILNASLHFSNSRLRGCCYLECWSIIWAFHLQLCLPVAVVTEGVLLLFYLLLVDCDIRSPFSILVQQHFIIEWVQIELIRLSLHGLTVFPSFLFSRLKCILRGAIWCFLSDEYWRGRNNCGRSALLFFFHENSLSGLNIKSVKYVFIDIILIWEGLNISSIQKGNFR